MYSSQEIIKLLNRNEWYVFQKNKDDITFINEDKTESLSFVHPKEKMAPGTIIHIMQKIHLDIL